MKKNTLLLSGLALLAGASLAQAQVLASDDFSYVGALTSNGWIAHSGGGAKTIMSDGQVATLDQSSGSGEDDSLVFAAQTATDVTYASFDFRVVSGTPVNPDAQGLYFAHFKDSGTNFSARTGVLSPAAAGDFVLAINADSADLGAGAQWPGDLAFDTTYSVVINYDANTSASTLWLNPVDMASASITSITGTSIGDLVEGFALRQSNDYTGFIQVDNVVVGKTFADVWGGSPAGPGTAFCFGDGTGTACPCGNAGAAGEGCANSTGGGAILAGTGSASIGSADLVLSASQVPVNQPTLFFQGDNAVAGGAGTVFGDGLRCAGGNVVRLQVRVANASGVAATTVNVSSKGGVVMGDVKRYQAWYRDPASSPCGAFFNLSNGYEITWGM
ncbi:MAG: hypothetical protein H6828_14415 [Planctomycetes bacterium]|nr:hypothetical protein [Planctomycetota bacterium]